MRTSIQKAMIKLLITEITTTERFLRLKLLHSLRRSFSLDKLLYAFTIRKISLLL